MWRRVAVRAGRTANQEVLGCYVVDLLEQAAARVEAIDRHVGAEAGIGQKRRAQPHRPAPRPRLRVEHRLILAAERVEALAQETAPRTGTLEGPAPTEIVGYRDVMRQLDLRRFEVLAHRSHAGRIGDLRD